MQKQMNMQTVTVVPPLIPADGAQGQQLPQVRVYVAGVATPAWHDLYSALRDWRLWTMLGWNDIRLRYRRSVLGPIWITLSTAILISVLSVIYSRIFRMDVNTYVPFVAIGLITWGFISATVNEACIAFVESERIIKQVKTSYSTYVLRTIWRNFIVFLHTIALYIPIALLFEVNWTHGVALLVIPGLVLLYLNLIWIALVLAIIGTRFRDVPQIVMTMVQVLMFATPIMWPTEALGPDLWIADVNPVYHLIELVRAPLIDRVPSMLSWVAAILMAVVGTMIALVLLRRASQRLIYWL